MYVKDTVKAYKLVMGNRQKKFWAKQLISEQGKKSQF